MQRKATAFLFVAILIALASLQFGLWQKTSYAQPDPTATLTPTLIPVGTASNWIPQERDFDGMLMVYVPAGCFLMGSEDGDSDEAPLHEVCITKPFWLDKYEVSQNQFKEKNGNAESAVYFKGGLRPVERITWTEAQAFCQARGGNLPTEAQWEYAARGPESWEYPWGAWDTGKAVWSQQGTANVGSIPAGGAWIGAMDMSGNVWEWVTDWYDPDYYENSPKDDPAGPNTGNARVLRGGSWHTVYTPLLRGAARGWVTPNFRDYDLGFRCARAI